MTDEKIKPTSEWMYKWYSTMNKQLFNNSLGSCILQPFTSGKGSNGSTLGWFKITGNNIKVERSTRKMYQAGYYGDKTYITRENFATICKPVIELNANYKAPEESWLNTLVHEMCHYYTYMDGIAPKQGHGPEFKYIGEIVSSRSNGTITIQRLASAEEMKSYELDDEIKAKNQARLEKKKANLYAVIVILDNGQIRLILTSSTRLIDDIGEIHANKNDIKYFGYSNDPNLINVLFSKGYKTTMRTYRFWDITDKNWVNSLPQYKWTNLSLYTLSEVLGINNSPKETNEPMTAVANNVDTNDTYKLGYKIIQDNNGYNLIDKNTNKKTFSKPVEQIWFNEKENLYCFKNGKFTFIGLPGKWSKYNNDMKENKEQEYLKRLIRETVEKIVNEKIGLDDDVIDINSDMNLGLASPLEFEQ